VEVDDTLVSLLVFDTSETLSVKSIPSGVVDFLGDTNGRRVRELSMRTSLVGLLVFGGFRIVDVEMDSTIVKKKTNRQW